MINRLTVALVFLIMSITATSAQYMTPSVNSPLFPSTPSTGQFPIASSGSAADWQSMSGDCTINSSGVMICLKTNNVLFGAFATANGTAATAALNAFTSSLQGVVPASGGGTTNFLRADGTFATPGTALLGSNNSWTAEQYFGGKPWFDVKAVAHGCLGAKGDGVTDDTTAIQCVINYVGTTYTAGIVFVPPGDYCTFTGVSVTGFGAGDIWLLGSAVRGSVLDACGHNTTVLTVNQQFGRTEELAVYGYGLKPTDVVANVTAPAILMNTGASYWELKHMLVQGGGFPLEVLCAGCRINQVTAQYAYGDSSGLRAANAYLINSGQYWFQDSFDQVLPCESGLCTAPVNPTFPTTVSAWAATHAYTSGTVITVNCGAGKSFFAQITVNGTSAGAQPTCKPYLNLVTDGSTSWYLTAANPSYAIQIDTGNNEVIIDSTDVTGFFSACVGVTNTFAGVAPVDIRFHSLTPGGCYLQGYLISAGVNITIEGGDFQGCILSGCAGVYVNNGASGFVKIEHVDFHNGGSYSILTGANVSGANITNNNLSVGSTASMAFGATNDFNYFSGNFCSTPTYTGSAGANSFAPHTTGGNPNC